MTPEAITRSLCEFIIAYIHAVSYVSNVYPRETYRLVQQYGTSTYQNSHTGVNIWIENASKSVMQLLYDSKGSGSNVVLSIVILEDGKPFERFGIDFVEYETKETPASQSQEVDISALDVSEQFKSCLVRLYSEGQFSDPGDHDRSMSLFFEGKTNTVEIPSTWLKLSAKNSVKSNNTHRVYPIRSIEVNSEGENVLVLNTFRQKA